VNEAVKQVGRGFAAPFLFDEAVRLKKQVGQQVSQIDAKKARTRVCIFVCKRPKLYVFCATSKKSAGLAILLPSPFPPVANNIPA